MGGQKVRRGHDKRPRQELNKEKTQEEVQSEPVPTLQQPLTKREQFGEV